MTVRGRIPARIRSGASPELSPGEAMYTANTTVRLITTQYGYSNYDALNLSVEKRYSHNFSARAAYSLGNSRGSPPVRGIRLNCKRSPTSTLMSTRPRRARIERTTSLQADVEIPRLAASRSAAHFVR